jgi:hypothetical protein
MEKWKVNNKDKEKEKGSQENNMMSNKKKSTIPLAGI